MRRALGLLALGFGLCALASNASAKTAAEVLSEMPVQHNGRVKPFDTFAREAVLTVTGGTAFEGLRGSELVWRWIASPEVWSTKPILKPGDKALREEFGVMAIRGRVSPEVVLGHKPFLDKAEAAAARRQKKERLTPHEQRLVELYEDALVFRDIASGAMPGWIPHPEEPAAAWLPFQGFADEEGRPRLAQFFPGEQSGAARAALSKLIEALREEPAGPKALRAALDFQDAMARLLETRGIFLDRSALGAELLYNRLTPFALAWKLYAAGLLLLLLPNFFSRAAGFASYLTGFAVHSFGFYLRCAVAGRPPVTNMYESLIWVSWGIVFFSLILWAVYRAPAIAASASAVAAGALVLAQGFPAMLDPSISPLVPVLRSNLWLTVHVLTITLGYGAFALAWGLGHGVVFYSAFARDPEEIQQKLCTFLYRALQIGVILLASGTVLGGVWANYSWGRFWGWDPKETWALIALLGYLAVLHGRFAGWLSPFGLAVGSVIAFLGVVMAWYGVNFVLAAGLHSYGFGGGGAPYVAAVSIADVLAVSWAASRYRKKQARPLGV